MDSSATDILNRHLLVADQKLDSIMEPRVRVTAGSRRFCARKSRDRKFVPRSNKE
jgi:hypothetical protein